MVKRGKQTPTPAQYARVVRELIDEKGMKHAEVSLGAGISAGSLSSVVNGKLGNEKAISGHIDNLCKFFGIKREELDRKALHEGRFGLASSRFGIDLGETLTLWSSAVGDGKTVLENSDIQVRFDASSEIELPLRVERLVSRVLKDQRDGKHTFKDNPVLTIFDASWFPFDGLDERPGVNLSLGTTSYALLYALRITEQGKQDLRDLLDEWEPTQEIEPMLSQGLGVSVVVLSNDNQLVFGRRFSEIGARAEEIDAGAVEGLCVKDVIEGANEGVGSIDIDAVMRRAVYEEFGITEAKISNMSVLNFGYDIGWAQWNFIGLCKTDLSAKEIQARHKSVAPQRTEYKETYVVEAVPDVVFQWLANEPRGIWSCGLASVFYAMINLHGIDEVEDATRGLSFKISHNLIWD